MEQAGTKVLSRRSATCAAESEDSLQEAAALHYMRTGVAVHNMEATKFEAVIHMLQTEAQGLSTCGDCTACIAGGGCKRAANREASRHGKRGAIWAEEAERLVGRKFKVCSSISKADVECSCLLLLSYSSHVLYCMQIDRRGRQCDCLVVGYDRRKAMHEVQWTVEAAYNTRGGGDIQVDKVDFATDLVRGPLD
jgi:hypothetical protein